MKEREIEDELERNLDQIEKGLKLVKRQKKVHTGVIDLFCKDKKGNHVILEIKKNPSTSVIGQLAKYNMALIKEGLNKKKLRTILVTHRSSKAIEGACEFFNFEIKKLGKYKEQGKDKRKGFPQKEDIMEFIKKREFVNFSMIAKHFDLNNATVSDFIQYLEKKVLQVKKIGGSKFVFLK